MAIARNLLASSACIRVVASVVLVVPRFVSPKLHKQRGSAMGFTIPGPTKFTAASSEALHVGLGNALPQASASSLHATCGIVHWGRGLQLQTARIPIWSPHGAVALWNIPAILKATFGSMIVEVMMSNQPHVFGHGFHVLVLQGLEHLKPFRISRAFCQAAPHAVAVVSDIGRRDYALHTIDTMIILQSIGFEGLPNLAYLLGCLVFHGQAIVAL